MDREATILPTPSVVATAMITDYFPIVSVADSRANTAYAFEQMAKEKRSAVRRSRERRRKMSRQEATVGMYTQNVMGFAKGSANIGAWFTYFRQRGNMGSHDVIFLQETHANEADIALLTQQHSRTWGFDPTQHGGISSWWSAAEERRAGVAILRNPYSCVSDVIPYMLSAWNAHWMAVTATVHGETTLLINIYAPHEPSKREAFYAHLASLEVKHTGPIFCGGDFNCTLNAHHDRTYSKTAGSHDSPGLRSLLKAWRLEDALLRDIETASDPRDITAFHAAHHTYQYTLPGGQIESSRLDRWYVSEAHEGWVRHIDTVVPGQFADHDGVIMRIAAASKRVRIKKQRQVYPVRPYAQEKAAAKVAELFESLRSELEHIVAAAPTSKLAAQASADWWDDVKVRFRKLYLAVSRECNTTMVNSYRQRLRRLVTAHQSELSRRASVTGPRLDSRAQSGLQGIRRRIVECKQDWARTKDQLLRRAHTQLPVDAARQFYARIATKFTENTVYSLGSVGAGSSPTRLADAMADGWTAVMQQQQANSAEVNEYLSQMRDSRPQHGLETMEKIITADEVVLAIKKCKRRKAHGPDELPNDWYRDHIEEISPLLVKLFNLWFTESVVPRSFADANIHCLKKTKAASAPLDHRPIALLNTDYKIFTRIFALRLRPILPSLVHPLQAGFVPGRSIHTPIDTLLVAQRLAQKDSALRDATCLLLDFAKAYDSLNRQFLTSVLQHIGFPAVFVQVVVALHTGTAARFLVNGFLSKRVDTTCGIRQGCPLAPLLFIVALDVLYRVVEARTDVKGITFNIASGPTELRISGYADDTALYLHDRTDVPKYLAVLQAFGEVSGLKVNVKKSVGVCLSGSVPEGCETRQDLPLLASGDTCRYLGVQVGQANVVAANWDGCIAALRTRLRLAFAKTHSVTQRAEIARAVIVPKVLYVARHAWPTERIITELHGFIKTFVWGSTRTERKRAWLSEPQAELPRKNGGLAVPNIRTELLAMGTTAVARWAGTSTAFERYLGDTLLGEEGGRTVFITPRAVTRVSRAIGSSMWVTGARILQSEAAKPATPEDRASLQRCAAVVVKGYDTAHWVDGKYIIDLAHIMGVEIAQRIALTTASDGAFCDEWLRHCSTRQDGWLLDRKGTPYALAAAGITAHTKYLYEVVRWSWIQKGMLSFEFVTGGVMATAPSKRAFQRLCFALLFNFPQLLYRPRAPTLLRPYSHSVQQVHEWHLTAPDQMSHSEATLRKATHAIDRARDMDNWATLDVKGKERVSFHANPHHSRLVQIWGGTARWTVARQNYKRHAASARFAAGMAQCAASAAVDDALRSNVSPVARGLSAVKWTDISRLPGLNTYERQTVYRLKAGKLTAWNSRDNDRSCPHEGCSTSNPALNQHIFWDCPEAKGLWTDIGCRWDRLGLFSATSRAESVYELCMPRPPRLAWARCRERDTRNQLTEDHLDLVYETADTAWRYSCAAAIACVWRHRNAAVHGTALSHHGFRAASLQRIRCGLVNLQLSARQGQDKHTARIKADLLFHFTAILFGDCEQWPIERPRHNDSQYLLFFDGGSRGNPGPGGSGSVVLRVNRHQRQACILWVASMAYSNRCTTNNMAEYMGLIHGLRFTQAHKCAPLHVVGDSAMIIRQQRHHIAPKQRRLAVLYRQTKRMADVMDISSWNHHYRAHNKMADLAANHAMDSSTSAQYDLPTTRWTGADIQMLMNNDVQHWFDQRQLQETDYLFE